MKTVYYSICLIAIGIMAIGIINARTAKNSDDKSEAIAESVCGTLILACNMTIAIVFHII